MDRLGFKQTLTIYLKYDRDIGIFLKLLHVYTNQYQLLDYYQSVFVIVTH